MPNDFTTMVRTERQLLRDQGQVMLTDDICEYSAEEFVQDMLLLVACKPTVIRVVISSDGGEIAAGLACIRAIRQAQRAGIQVIGEVYGHAMSMAFLILQHCDERVMGAPDVLMAHGITTFTAGDIKNHEAEGKLLRYWQDYFAEFVVNRITTDDDRFKDADFWMQIMADNTPQFYGSQECLAMGLVDEVCE